jgi:hypothetical protein
VADYHKPILAIFFEFTVKCLLEDEELQALEGVEDGCWRKQQGLLHESKTS